MRLGEQFKLRLDVKTMKMFASNQSSFQCEIHVFICTIDVCKQTLEKSFHFGYSGACSACLPSSSEYVKWTILIQLSLCKRVPNDQQHQKESGQGGNTCLDF